MTDSAYVSWECDRCDSHNRTLRAGSLVEPLVCGVCHAPSRTVHEAA